MGELLLIITISLYQIFGAIFNCVHAYQNEDRKASKGQVQVNTTIIEKPTDTKLIIKICTFTSPFISHQQHKNLANRTV